MKSTKIIYWITTSLVSLMMCFSAYAYFSNPMVKEGFHHLGFPDYFRIELGIAKIIGAIVLIVPMSAIIKEWAYAGFAITFVSAFIAHAVSGDPASNTMNPIIFLIVLIGSYITFHKLQNKAVKA